MHPVGPERLPCGEMQRMELHSAMLVESGDVDFDGCFFVTPFFILFIISI